MTARPRTIHAAMRYSLFAGGKRMRPALCLAAASACGGSQSAALPLACAVECIHTYSLIHDDLPAMDNDDFRRGKPTNHKVFGEGIAVLAGDALLTQAFEIAAQCKGWPRYSHQQIILELARASGSLQLIAGQVADLEGEGKKIQAPQLRYIHERKTSAVLCCAVRLGGMSANCTPAQLKALTDFGYHVGLAFLVAAVSAVNLLELRDGFFAFAHFFENRPEIVKQVLFLVVEPHFFFDRLLERAGSEIIDAAARIALGQVIHGGNTLVRVELGLLKLLDGFAD